MRINNKGITLIELIIAIGLLSMVITVAFSIFITGYKGFQRDTSTKDNQFNVRHASSYIGSEIRKANIVEVNSNILRVTHFNGNIIEYKLIGNSIKQNSNTLVDGIQTFNVIQSGDRITLYFKSVENSEGKSFELSSEIIIRR